MKRSITFITAGFILAGAIAGAVPLGAAAAERTTADYAKEIALSDAGLSEDEVEFEDIEKGMEQGTSVYEIEFWSEDKEYDYDIALADGEIVSVSWEIIDPSPSGKQINQARAKSIALEYAGVDGKDAAFTKSGSGTEKGIPVFELKFEDSSAMYKYDIAKDGGEILSYSKTIKNPASVGRR